MRRGLAQSAADRLVGLLGRLLDFGLSRFVEPAALSSTWNWPIRRESCDVSCESERLVAVDCSTIAAFCCVT